VGDTERLKLLALGEDDFLPERPVEDELRGLPEGRAGDGEGLEPGPVLAARFEPGGLELVGDVLRGGVDALGGRPAPLALVGGEEEDVLLEAGLGQFGAGGGLLGGAGRKPKQESHAAQQQG
jgi:hypothetical protein